MTDLPDDVEGLFDGMNEFIADRTDKRVEEYRNGERDSLTPEKLRKLIEAVDVSWTVSDKPFLFAGKPCDHEDERITVEPNRSADDDKLRLRCLECGETWKPGG